MKSAFVPSTVSAIAHHALDSSTLVQYADEAEMRRETVEAQIAAARRRPLFAWIGLLALLAPWGVAALVWSAMRAG